MIWPALCGAPDSAQRTGGSGNRRML